jgi:hypothetical protein
MRWRWLSRTRDWWRAAFPDSNCENPENGLFGRARAMPSGLPFIHLPECLSVDRLIVSQKHHLARSLREIERDLLRLRIYLSVEFQSSSLLHSPRFLENFSRITSVDSSSVGRSQFSESKCPTILFESRKSLPHPRRQSHSSTPKRRSQFRLSRRPPNAVYLKIIQHS